MTIFDDAAAAFGYDNAENLLENFNLDEALFNAGETARDRAECVIIDAIYEKVKKRDQAGLAEMVEVAKALPKDDWAFADDDDSEEWTLEINNKKTKFSIVNHYMHHNRGNRWEVYKNGDSISGLHDDRDDAEDIAYAKATRWLDALSEAQATRRSESRALHFGPRGAVGQQDSVARRITIRKKNPSKKKKRR